jgi:hypothetical protein
LSKLTCVTDALQTPRSPCAFDIVEIVGRGETTRLHAVVEVADEPHLRLRLERPVTVPHEVPVRWFDGDTAWQAASQIDHIDEVSVNCRLAPTPEWEPARVRQSLRAVVSNSPILIRAAEEPHARGSRPLHALCLDVSASGCRTTWPAPPPTIGDRIEIAWEVDGGYDSEPQWITASIARVIEMPFGKRQVGLRFELAEQAHAARVREWHQKWLQESRRRGESRPTGF